MKAVFPLALLGALAIGTAQAAETGSQSHMSGSQSSAAGKAMQHQKWSQKQVQEIQSKLKEQGYEVGQVDGKFGPATKQALREFQADKGINSSGQPDAQTLAALDLGSGGVQTGQMPGAGRPTPPASGGENQPGGTSQPPAGSEPNQGGGSQ